MDPAWTVPGLLAAATLVLVTTTWFIAMPLMPATAARAMRRARSLHRLVLGGRRQVDRISINELQEFEHEFHDEDFGLRLQQQMDGELVQLLLLCAVYGLPRTLWEVAQRLDPHIHRAHLNNALLIAASNGRVRVVRVLVGQNLADVNARSSHHNSALILAASKGHVEIVKLLLACEALGASGIDVNQTNSFKITALASACEHGHADIVDALLQRPDVDPSINANLAVRSAALRRHDRIVLKLLEASPGQFSPGRHRASARRPCCATFTVRLSRMRDRF